MLNIFLIIHCVVAALLISAILLQKTGNDGLAGIGGSKSTQTAASRFMVRTTAVLACVFMANAIILGNLSSKEANVKLEHIKDS
ncbi:Preprotein translocase subunit SecG [Rickettsiales endosymbiont of Paramecium tredecaurelia]|uniref:preprotein translocase subunit SecG n=1 Tax=Candidatus Sarmatiella mevalonica TaxID=2770581 RepID=UPI001920BCE7|nr:preprotein translocase subunit SecG [Candidatus Sarmatiella mevalonica]MBL3284265.1 Preprotein translocase subunit SecG [Candidatus Sarmatiella mevalonica]